MTIEGLERASRIFVVKASSAFVHPNLNIEALASYGRLDVVARAAIAAVSTRRGPRRNVLLYAVLEGGPQPLTFELRGWEMPPQPILSESHVGAMLKALLRGCAVPGARIHETCFREVVTQLISSLGPSNTYYMHEQGTDVSRVALKEPAAFILGDHKGVERATEQWLKSIGTRWLSLGSTPYFTEHCITYVHALLDGLRLA